MLNISVKRQRNCIWYIHTIGRRIKQELVKERRKSAKTMRVVEKGDSLSTGLGYVSTTTLDTQDKVQFLQTIF